MWKYLLLQFKRIGRILPLVLVVVLILYCGLILVFDTVMDKMSNDDTQTKFDIALVGDPGDTYLNMGVAALQSFDSSRYAVNLLQMDEQEAKKALERGDIGAYVIVPDGFVDAAIEGRVIPLKYVSTAGSAGLVSIFKEEITKVISDIVLACQRGMYGIEGVLESVDYSDLGKYMNAVSVSYAEFALIRSRTYRVDELGAINELGMEGHLFCGISVLFLMLILLPFGALYIKQDLSLNRILSVKRLNIIQQVLCEILTLFISLSAMILLTMLILTFSFNAIRIDISWLMGGLGLDSFISLLPAIFMLATFAYMLFCFADELVGGMLLSFFAGVGMCFISGCMYPIYFFPESVQKLAAVLPHSIAREHLSNIVTMRESGDCVTYLLLYGATFAFVAICARYRRMYSARG